MCTTIAEWFSLILFVSLAGPRAMAIAAGAGCAFVGLLYATRVLLGQTDLPLLESD